MESRASVRRRILRRQANEHLRELAKSARETEAPFGAGSESGRRSGADVCLVVSHEREALSERALRQRSEARTSAPRYRYARREVRVCGLIEALGGG